MIVLALTLALAASPATPRCGTERWAVKTLTDGEARRVNLHPFPSSVEALVKSKAPPYDDKNLRADLEERAFTVTAQVIAYKLEADSDFHVVIRDDAGRTMIAEFTNPECAKGSRVAKQMAQARRQFLRLFAPPTPKLTRLTKRPVRVTLTGVGFYDKIHGQTGVAPNGVELHPVLSVVAAP